ncbi:MAG TPA: hypothetical protein VL357_05725 [Rariglobus sp.]|nr:hypothetical protein [Rariglobus sp.]
MKIVDEAGTGGAQASGPQKMRTHEPVDSPRPDRDIATREQRRGP